MPKPTNAAPDVRVAPTNAATLAKLSAGPSESALDFVTLVHQTWLTDGEVITRARANSLGIPEKEYLAYVENNWIKESLAERGVDWPPPVGDITVAQETWRTVGLKPQQLLVANAMLDLTDTRSNKKKLQDLGVSFHQYNSWLRDPKFSGYLKERAEQLLGTHQHEARLALMDRVSAGDVKAIQFYLELTGEYTPAAQRQNEVQALDFQNLLVAIVEIISDEVDDPHTAARIADRFKGLMTARTVATELLGPNPAELPQVAPGREMTPQLQKLMNAGGNT